VSCLLDEGDQFQDYTQAIRNLARDSSFPSALIRQLERLPGFRNVVIHEYVALDMDQLRSIFCAHFQALSSGLRKRG
jgi:uncharacterized protein YutE (UPF0331/DUF86 family)